jgi:CRP-like cAMP-binding protein
MLATYNPSQNYLLAALSLSALERISPHIEIVKMNLGDTLYEPGEQLKHAYFPITAIVSLHYVLASGASAEFARVGNEGMVGIPLFLGGNSMPSSAMVQTAGYAYQLASHFLKEEFNRVGELFSLLLRYTQALATQTSQAAACNRHHSIQQQLCQYLLLTLDRLNSSELFVTQELVAFMLGVRREGISEAASVLQRDGFIRSRRGHIEVLERSGLEAGTCECYSVVTKEIKRLLPLRLAV